MKKVLLFTGLLLILNVITPTYAITHEDFAENENYYREMCTNTLQSDQREVCTSFQEYLNDKIKGTTSSIEDLSASIAAVEDDLAEADRLLRQQQEEILAAQQEIEKLSESISIIEENILVLNETIEKRTQEIGEVNELIKKRLVSQQANLHTNSMVEFLFGGNSYTDLARRAHTVDQMTRQDQEQMDWFVAEKEQLEDDNEELNRQQVVLEDSLANQNELKGALEVAKAENEKTIEIYQEEVANLSEQQAILQSQQSVSQSAMDNILSQFVDLDNREEQLRQEALRLKQEAEAERQRQLELEQQQLAAQEEAERIRLEQEAAEAERIAAEKEAASDAANQEADEVAQNPPAQSDPIGTGSGWSLPVYGATVTAGAWYYGGGFAGIHGGSVHYGVDFGAPMGTPIYSTGPGVVVQANANCPAWGGLGNACGNYGGNQVTTIVSINNSLYGLLYAHLQAPAVSVGQTISSGQVIGYLGSSGNSSGPHLHHEVFYLGDMSLQDYLSTWNGSLSFTPNGTWMNLNWACEVKGSAPCRHNPQSWYGLQVGGVY